MMERYDGDPRNIFKDVQDYDEALDLIRNDGKGGGFKGFQHKMTSMIIYYLQDDKLIDELPGVPYSRGYPCHARRISEQE